MTNITKQAFGDRLTVTYLLVGIFLLIVLNILTDFLFELKGFKLFVKLAFSCGHLLLMGYLVYFIWNKFSEEEAISSDSGAAQKKIETKGDLRTGQRTEVKEEKVPNPQASQLVLLQLNQWGLSPSEKEIALYLLAGKSSKQIAEARFTSERTIRNQCGFIYGKSGCAGRSEFSAYFFNHFLSYNEANLRSIY